MLGAPNELSFLPDDYLERKQRRRTNAICAVLFCVVIAGIGGAFTVTERSMREIEKQYTDVEQQYTEAAKRIDQVQQMQQKQQTMAHQAELTASLLEKVPRSFILAEITNGIPQGVSLLDFAMASTVSTKTPAAAPKTAFEARQAEINAAANGGSAVNSMATAQVKNYDVTMKITGVAPNDGQVAQFISKLDKSTMFDDVNLVFTDEFKDGNDNATKMRKFQIEMTLNPEAKIDPGTTPVHDTGTAAVQIETPK
jgi:Tfp pilus assembly protein PilN